MRFSLYLQIERLAGGVTASPRQFIRAVHTLLTEEAKTRTGRKDRHKLIREVLWKRLCAIKLEANSQYGMNRALDMEIVVSRRK